MINLCDELRGNAYPGRGIVIGKTSDDENIAVAYFIMGRSENSRNRVFEETSDGIRTKAYDEKKLTDPSLIIYHPVRKIEDYLIVTNGDQTDTIYDFIKIGKTFEEALRTREFEPDDPNFTPRISGIVKNNSYKLSILKSAEGNKNSCRRYFYEYENLIPGEGHFIHTYKCDGNPIPSFEGEPTKVKIEGDLETFTEKIWESLNFDNKVSLYTNFINLKTGESKIKIVNKWED